ncbi:uncharacterized protein F4822DRAFT_221209 [Hypoxylon trugodes]|uniref:uncharacterized protein n=1 Tax=Hypoxylon trugodes TaxID=326681 RepID=UPI0021A06CC2|nr:uncharacterized protein F4822DRAFT_221209 [Hypoxylon trugodes]KAI1390024.1 hypothetical protein F4822DRAFT_221209 [Hypoxylon trugodes]
MTRGYLNLCCIFQLFKLLWLSSVPYSIWSSISKDFLTAQGNHFPKEWDIIVTGIKTNMTKRLCPRVPGIAPPYHR